MTVKSLALSAPFVVLALVALGCTAGRAPGGATPSATDAGVPGTDPDPTGDPRPTEGGGVYHMDDGSADPLLCPPSAIVGAGCMTEMDEGEMGMCNQVDDDCDGEVDEDCFCTPGDVQHCFLGPPGRRNQGACQDGNQTCEANGEFGGYWGPCEGGISPSTEVCDDLDNDCNGCRDEIEGCEPTGSCPGPGDPRVPEARPFSSYSLRGADFYTDGDATAWHWEIQGSPCDRMFQNIPGSTATPTNGQLSYALHNENSQDASVDFTLSGDYTVTLNVDRRDGSTFSCTWIVNVRAPGLRVELCWDATGPTADSTHGGTVDVDLHLARMGMTGQWFDDADCHYMNCKASSFSGSIGWGYPDTPIDNCTGPGARGGFDGSCPNPRLDIDNISTSDSYVPENINLDNPNDGDSFRVMVHHYTSTDRATKPIVNVYCGGELRGTYGAAPDDVTGFDQGGGRESGDMWRVVDIATSVSGGTTDCALTPITPPGTMSGYHITMDDISL